MALPERATYPAGHDANLDRLMYPTSRRWDLTRKRLSAGISGEERPGPTRAGAFL
jgi:hypothetical protein